MGLYESMELEVIAAEQNWRVADNHTAADTTGLTRGWDQVWDVACLMYGQVVGGLAPRVRAGKLSRKRYDRLCETWLPDPAILRREVDW